MPICTWMAASYGTAAEARSQQENKGGMVEKIDGFLPATTEIPNLRQRYFARHIIGILMDYTVLNLFNEYSDSVSVASYSWALIAAILLQVLLMPTVAVERQIAGHFNEKQGEFMKVVRFVVAWLVPLVSKSAILGVIAVLFGDKVRFEGMLNGAVPLIIVVVTMILLEELLVRMVRWVR